MNNKNRVKEKLTGLRYLVNGLPVALRLSLIFTFALTSALNFTSTAHANDFEEAFGRFVPLPGGQFVMGSPQSEAGRHQCETEHKVELSPFKINEAPVTRSQFKKLIALFEDFTQMDPGTENDEMLEALKIAETIPQFASDWDKANLDLCQDCPLTYVSRNQAALIIKVTNKIFKDRPEPVRLPTEAQREYVSRVWLKETPAAKTAIPWVEKGPVVIELFQGAFPPLGTLIGLFWFRENSWMIDQYDPSGDRNAVHVHPVKETPTGNEPWNGLGIYQTNGNTYDWVEDYYGPYFPLGSSVSLNSNEIGKDPVAGAHIDPDFTNYAARGGSYNVPENSLRFAARFATNDPNRRFGHIGIRFASW